MSLSMLLETKKILWILSYRKVKVIERSKSFAPLRILRKSPWGGPTPYKLHLLKDPVPQKSEWSHIPLGIWSPFSLHTLLACLCFSLVLTCAPSSWRYVNVQELGKNFQSQGFCPETSWVGRLRFIKRLASSVNLLSLNRCSKAYIFHVALC